VSKPLLQHGVGYRLGPVIAAASAFAVSDVSGKLALDSGTNVVSLLAFRSAIGLGLVFLWLRIGRKSAPLPTSPKLISLGLGLLLTLNLAGVFEAVALIPVSIAILAYFVYPLLTGLVGAATGIDRLTPVAFATAIVAFLGLALIIGANPVALSGLGLAAALFGAVARVAMLLITRASLGQTDARLVTWYTLWSSMLMFAVLAAAKRDWHWPAGVPGWVAFIGIGFTSTAAIVALYVSTQRIGPFRTALYMNLEPLMTAVLSTLVLGDRMAPPQILGAAVMIAALFLFQWWR
jgi:probable blue pigment (indigoidine) exporter